MSDFFQFKQFKVYHGKSSMKVGTDAVLLGCYLPIENCKNILEIGCGSGVISLVAAQRSEASILGIDIHKDSVLQAQQNYDISPWASLLTSQQISLQELAENNNQRFDCIMSNPPFFENSMKSPSSKRNLARHNDSLSPTDLILSVKKLLNPNGILSLVLPKTEGEDLIRLSIKHGFFLKKKVLVFPKASKDYNRVIFDLIQVPMPTTCEKLIIREENNEYTVKYRELTKDFYLAF